MVHVKTPKKSMNSDVNTFMKMNYPYMWKLGAVSGAKKKVVIWSTRRSGTTAGVGATLNVQVRPWYLERKIMRTCA